MQTALASQVGQLTDWGWSVHSHTEDTAALETRGPFNWVFFALLVLLFPFIGGLLYVAFWLITSRLNVFLRVENGEVVTSGDTWYVQRQAAQAAATRQMAQDIKDQGFLKAMGPSIIAAVGRLFGVQFSWSHCPPVIQRPFGSFAAKALILSTNSCGVFASRRSTDDS